MALTHRRSRWTALALAAITTTGLVTASIAAVPAAATTQARHHVAAMVKKAKKTKHPAGFFTTDAGQVTPSTAGAALARDGHDGEHVISVVPGATAGMGHLVYSTRKAGATKWTSNTIPGARPITGIRVEIHINDDDNRVSMVVFECDGVYAADTGLSAGRMPVPTQIQAGNSCPAATTAHASATNSAAPANLAFAEYGNAIGVLLPDPAHAGEVAVQWGKPGQTFSTMPDLPTTDSVVVSQLAFDDSTGGRLVAVGEGTDGTNKGIYVMTDRDYGSMWSKPVLIATLNSPTSDYTVESVTTYGNQVWVGLERTVTSGGVTKHHLYVDHGTPSGQWDGVIALVHSTTSDTSLRLLINPLTRTVHAAFTRVTPGSHTKKSGIVQEALEKGHWSTPKFFTHWYRDTTQQITINNAGRAVIGYEQS